MLLSDYQRYRLFEILPGVTVWGTLFLSVLLSFTHPLVMIYAIIIFDVYWVLKVLNFSFYLILATLRYNKVKQIDWHDVIVHSVPSLETYHHVVFLTLYKEDWEVVDTAVQSLCDAAYDAKQFTIVIAGEARAQAHFDMILAHVKEKYADCFDEIIGIAHPANLPGEIPGKGSNLHYAEGQMKKYIDAKQWSYDDVIVTVFDIDTVCDSHYFAYLTYLYHTHPNPTRSSFQPIALFNNNMWDSPAVLRIMAFGTTFWLFMALARQDSLVTFSSHSMSFKALHDVGYHDKRIVSEDSRIFFQCYLHYDGQYDVTPMYMAVSMDTVRDDSLWKSLTNLYKQQRRWAWGTEHIPYLITEFKKKGNRIAWHKKVKWIFYEWEGKWSWALAAILITVLGRLPTWDRIVPDAVEQSALFFNTPHVLQSLMTISMVGLLLSALLSFPLLPDRPKSHPKHRYIFMLVQWALLPFSLIFVSAIPAIDAVTHMMFGKYLGFNVSQKKRK